LLAIKASVTFIRCKNHYLETLSGEEIKVPEEKLEQLREK